MGKLKIPRHSGHCLGTNFNPSLMTTAGKVCRIAADLGNSREEIQMPLVLALIGVALDVPHELVGGLLAIFLVRELA